MKHEIMKKMVGNGVELMPGDIVDTSEWLHVKSLESLRYIRPVEDTTVPSAPAKPKAVKKSAPKTKE